MKSTDFITLKFQLEQIAFKSTSKNVAFIFFFSLSQKDSGKGLYFHLEKLTI